MSELALQLIAENKRTRDTFLDLGNCGLTEIPAEVGELVWLESLLLGNEGTLVSDLRPLAGLAALQNLDVSGTWVTDLAPLASLSGLRTLHISHTPVKDLRPLAGLSGLQTLYAWDTKVTNIRPLAGLFALREVSVSQTRVTDLMPLAGLSALQMLDVSDTSVTHLAPLAGLSSLQTLVVSGTQVTDLGPLARLSALQTVDISRTKVCDLGPLAGLSALGSLDVSNTRVSDLSPLANLLALRTLEVSGTQVRDLAPLARLSGLQMLSVYSTTVSDLTPLAGLSALQMLDLYRTPVSDLGPLAGLSALQTLDVQYTKLADLGPLAGLLSLQRLNVQGTQVNDLGPLTSLPSLQSLDVQGTQVSDLGPLANLFALQVLYVSRTEVVDLRPLASLASLQRVHLSGTKITNLSPLFGLIRRGLPVKSNLGEGDGIYIRECPLNLPREIVARGDDAILNYFRELAQGEVDHLYEAKMLILGEGGAGKTSLLRRLYEPDKPLPKEDETTRGISIHRHEFTLKNGRRFRLNVWDFGGQQIYHATHQFFLTHRSLYVLVDDTRKDYKAASDEGFKYWLELIDVFSGHSPTLIFQNEKGGRSKQIDLAGIRQRFDNVKEVYAGNLDNIDAAGDVRDAIEHFASHLAHIGEELPARWIKVREEIETLAAEKPYVPLEDYFDIYRKHIEFDETKALHLSRYLHDLGVFLHFQDDPLLARTVILQNEWATLRSFKTLSIRLEPEKLVVTSNE